MKFSRKIAKLGGFNLKQKLLSFSSISLENRKMLFKKINGTVFRCETWTIRLD